MITLKPLSDGIASSLAILEATSVKKGVTAPKLWEEWLIPGILTLLEGKMKSIRSTLVPSAR